MDRIYGHPVERDDPSHPDHNCRFHTTEELGVLEETDLAIVLLRRCRGCGLCWKVTVQIVDLSMTPSPLDQEPTVV